MAVVELRPAGDFPLESLTSAFNSGYAGYTIPVNIDENQLRHHITAYDIDLDASRVAITQGEITGFVLLGLRQQRGWIGGLGVHPDYRRRGTGRLLMQAAIGSAASNNVMQLYLEVISDNTAAYNLYQSLGFTDLRRLLVLESNPDQPQAHPSTQSVVSASVTDALPCFHTFHRAATPWQRSYETLARLEERAAQSWLLMSNNEIQAYVIGLAGETYIQFFDMACAPGHADDLHYLVSAIHHERPTAKARFVNLGEDEPAWPVLEKLGYHIILSQHEMVRVI